MKELRVLLACSLVLVYSRSMGKEAGLPRGQTSEPPEASVTLASRSRSLASYHAYNAGAHVYCTVVEVWEAPEGGGP